MKKIAIFTDIHGNLEALTSILYDIDKNKYDEIVCLGDFVGIGANSKECLELLMNRKDIKVVLGNHELYQIKGPYIKEQPEENRLHAEWIRGILNDKDMAYLNSLDLSYEKLIDNNLFTFSHFFIENEKDDYPFLLFEDNQELISKALQYPSNNIFVGHLHKRIFLKDKNTTIFALESSGCTLSNQTSYIEVISDGALIVNTKYVTYDRKLYEKKLREVPFPYKMV